MSTVCSRYFSIAAAACSAARNKRDIVQDRSYFSERSSPASWRRQACAPTALPPSWARTRPSVPCGPDGHSRHCLPKRNTKSLSNFHHTSQSCSFQHLHSHNSMQRQIHHSTCMLRRVDSAGQLFHTSASNDAEPPARQRARLKHSGMGPERTHPMCRRRLRRRERGCGCVRRQLGGWSCQRGL